MTLAVIPVLLAIMGYEGGMVMEHSWDASPSQGELERTVNWMDGCQFSRGY